MSVQRVTKATSLCVMAPARTPAPVIAQLAAAVRSVCEAADTRERLASLGAIQSCGDAAELGRVVADDYRRWGDVIRAGNIQLN